MISTLLVLVAGYGLLSFCLWRWQAHLIFYPTQTIGETPADYGVAYEPVSIQLEHEGGIQNLDGWWLPGTASKSKAILYLHGNGDNITIPTYVAQAVRMRNLGFSVLLFDYRGFGRSNGAFPSEVSVYEDAEYAWRYLLGRIGGTAKNAFIYGHSLGGAIAIEIAVRHPDAAGLVVESSFTSMRQMGRHFAVFGLFPVSSFLCHHFESIDKVSALKMPVLFIHGTKDLTVPCRMSQQLFAAAPEPKQLLIIPGGHHLDNAAVGGGKYLDVLRDFLSRN